MSLDDTQLIAKANLKRVMYLALCIMTLFIAYCAHQNLVSQLYIQLGFGNLGQICLTVGWLFFSLSSAVAAHYQEKMDAKTGLIIGAVGHSSFLVAGTLTSYCARTESTTGMCSYSLSFSSICSASSS